MSENGEVRLERPVVGRCMVYHTDSDGIPYIRFFLRNSVPYANRVLHFFEQLCCSGVPLPERFGANPTVSAGNGTCANDDNQMQVDSLKKAKEKGKGTTTKPERKSHEQHEQHSAYQHVQELWQNWTLGEGLLETRWRSVRQLHR